MRALQSKNAPFQLLKIASVCARGTAYALNALLWRARNTSISRVGVSCVGAYANEVTNLKLLSFNDRCVHVCTRNLKPIYWVTSYACIHEVLNYKSCTP